MGTLTIEEMNVRDEAVLELMDEIEIGTMSLSDETDVYRKMALLFSGYLTPTQLKAALKEAESTIEAEFGYNFEAMRSKALDEVIQRRGER